MDKKFAPEKYGMMICPLCRGKRVLIKVSDQPQVMLRRVCTECGGFGAIRKEEETFENVRNENLIEKKELT
jgi:DnaJ-class molecular chaperone